ncbi:MAG: hypothetical protein GY838_09555 [bacterium]|nr:hypothetical protein [bacterium]
MDERIVLVAEVVKAVGLKGEVKLYPLLDFHPVLLDSGYLMWEDGREVRILGHRQTKGGVVIRADASRDRDAAEALVGRTLAFRREDYLAEDFPRPAEGLPFRYLGRPVVTGAGEPVGVVDEVRRAGGSMLLVIAAGSGEILIPAVAPILRPDDGLEGELVVDPPEGLLDVNRS